MVDQEIRVNAAGEMTNAKIHWKGCRGCLAETFVCLLLHKPEFKEFFNRVIREANRRKAQNNS